MVSETSWKTKYLRELEAFDQQKGLAEAERNALERMLVRTSLASQGQHPELDRLLDQLRGELRARGAGGEQWVQLQDKIDHQLKALDEHKAESIQQLNGSFRQLLSTARSHPLFAVHGRDLRKLDKALRRAGTLETAMSPWLTELCTLLVRVLHQTPASSTGPASKVLGKLFGSTGEDAEAARAGIPLEEFADTEDEEQRVQICRRVAELLAAMQDQLVLEPAAEARARRLQLCLAESSDWDELRCGLDGVADLVIAAVTRGQREFEAFLRRLDDRLRALQEHFDEQHSAQTGRHQARQGLDQNIHRELQALGERVEASADLGELKHSVTGHLEAITSTVASFREQEAAREENLGRQLQAMQEKLVAVEANCEQMQARLKEERGRALTDALTELPNREAWQERLAFESDRWRRYGHSLTIGVLDIDLFKRVNDSYGHRAGDRVLQLVSRSLRERLRATDFIARFGGEEFVVLFPETGTDDAWKVLDGLREYIAELPFHFHGEPVSVTFSAGLAAFMADDHEDLVFDRADKALYNAKAEGRNRICIAG